MIAMTANRLDDGRVVYLASDSAWVEDIRRAALFDDEDSALSAVADTSNVVGLYSIELEDQAPAGSKRLRERIRRDGPTTGTTHVLTPETFDRSALSERDV